MLYDCNVTQMYILLYTLLYLEVFFFSLFLLERFLKPPFSLLWNSLSHTECGLGNSLALKFC